MTNFLKQYWQTLLLFLILTLIFISPQLSIHSPTLIDDGSDLFKAASNDYLKLFIQETFKEARTKTFLLIYRKIAFDLFYLDLGYHFLLQAMFLWTTIFATYYLLKQMKIPSWLSIFASLTILILPSTIANYYRLGTSEQFQFLLVLLSLIFIKRRLLSLFLITLACFFKENSIFF